MACSTSSSLHDESIVNPFKRDHTKGYLGLRETFHCKLNVHTGQPLCILKYLKSLALLSYTDFDWSPDGKEGFIWRRQKFEAVEINTIKNHMRSVSHMSVSHMCD